MIYAFFLSVPSFAAAIVANDGLIEPKAAEKFEQIANELKQKCGVTLAVAAKQSLGGQTIAAYEEEVAKNLPAPSVVLALAVAEQKVDILTSGTIASSFKKDKILDDYVIPIIVAVNKDDANHKYEAALLNGTSEIAEEIAASRSSTMFNVVAWFAGTKSASEILPGQGIHLESALGNTTHNLISFLRILFYAMIVLTVVAYLRSKRRYGEKQVSLETYDDEEKK